MENKKLDLSQYTVRTDLAVEAKDLAHEKEASPKKELKGFTIKEYEEEGIKVQTMDIDEEGAKLSGKKAGRYLTFETQGIRQQDSALQDNVINVFAKEFSAFLDFLNISEDASCLIVGLGNWNVTPDSLGPLVTESLLVTRHLFKLQPENVQDRYQAGQRAFSGCDGLDGDRDERYYSRCDRPVKA